MITALWCLLGGITLSYVSYGEIALCCDSFGSNCFPLCFVWGKCFELFFQGGSLRGNCFVKSSKKTLIIPYRAIQLN